LTGSAGADWFFASLGGRVKDEVPGQQAGEEINSCLGPDADSPAFPPSPRVLGRP
jgi:hypothetical protein